MQGRLILHAAVHFLRSFRSCKVQIGLGIAAWMNGASKELMTILHHSCLSMSYASINSILGALADSALDKARQVASGPHALAYDNINISTSIFVEQVPGMPNKVQSGTFAVIYELLNANLGHMDIQPIVERLKSSSPLLLSDLRPGKDAMMSYSTQVTVNICKILFKYVNGLEEISTDSLFRHPSRRQMPSGCITKFHPLRVATIEEASTEGNLLVHDDVYTVQLARDPHDLKNMAIPSFNDQLTNARIRGAQELRRHDIDAWERREVFQLAFGTFHLVMNFMNAILQMHRGTLQQIGSFSYFFTILEKTRLNSDHPDFHTLLATFTQIIEGLILNAWHLECGTSSLEDFVKSNPSAEFIFEKARKIFAEYATPKVALSCISQAVNPRVPARRFKDVHLNTDGGNRDPDSENLDSETDNLPEASDATSRPKVDIVHDNVVLMMRDLLYLLELNSAIQTGDWGRIEDILPALACIFRGAGSNNYSTEILHLLFNIKKVWTPEFALVLYSSQIQVLHFLINALL